MVREFDLTKGSQAIAKQFRARYPQYRVPLRNLAELADEARGRRLSRGRPAVSRGRRP
jgi:hypothetical protein